MVRSNLFWLWFLLLTFIVTLPLSWWGLAKVDFFYSSLHDSTGIDKHIERYAPRNRFNKLEFEKTSKVERVALFSGVVDAIHNLLDKLKPIIIVVMLIWLGSMFWIFIKRRKMPSAKCLIVYSLILLFLVCLVLSLGPEKVFNQLHIWIFPDNHQWFFYYEDSLMSTMMKAPYLFAYIAAIWAFISIILTIIVLKLMRLILNS